jgi:parallel beta-helix repeat protein
VYATRLSPFFHGLMALAATTILVTAAPAGAAAPGCGDVITKDTTLHADLEDCPGDGLVIGAGGITLDLNGHSIEGTGSGGLYGGGGGADIVYGDTKDGVDNTAGHSAVTIENGEIEDFDVGVKLYEADSNHLTGLDLYGNLVGALPLESDGNLIESNYSHNNSYGLYPYESDRNTIVDNLLEANTFGMYPVESSDNRIERNSVERNFFLGMQVTEDSNRNWIRDNVITDSHSFGLLVADSTDNLVEGNRLTGHAVAGLAVVETERTLVRRNTISSGAPVAGAPPPLAGILVTTEGHDVALLRNSVSGYPIGLHLQGPQTGLVVSRNRFTANTGDGIFSEEGIAGLIDRNVAARNGDDGIDVRDPRTKIMRNLAYSNADYGIEAVPGADGGGNLAWGNGNPAQCLNVVCSG